MPGTLNWLASFGAVSGFPSDPSTGVEDPSGLMTYIVSPTFVTEPAASFGTSMTVPVAGSRRLTGLVVVSPGGMTLPSGPILSSWPVAVGAFGSATVVPVLGSRVNAGCVVVSPGGMTLPFASSLSSWSLGVAGSDDFGAALVGRPATGFSGPPGSLGSLP